MIQHNAQNVLVAFDVLIEEMEEARLSIHKGGADVLGTGNYERAQTAIEHARRVMLLCEKLAALRGEWKEVEGTFSIHQDPEQHTPLSASVLRPTSRPPAHTKPHAVVPHEPSPPVGRLIAGRIREGLRTPEPAFFCPILQALSELGGSAKRSAIFQLLEHSIARDAQRVNSKQPVKTATVG